MNPLLLKKVARELKLKFNYCIHPLLRPTCVILNEFDTLPSWGLGLFPCRPVLLVCCGKTSIALSGVG